MRDAEMTGFGDRVRIKSSPETQAAGIAGREGDVYGFTTPSVTNVKVVGESPDDEALYISIDGHSDSVWIRPDLVELLHHNAGMEIKIGNAKAVRQPDGSWLRSPARQSELTKGSASLWARIVAIFKR